MIEQELDLETVKLRYISNEKVGLHRKARGQGFTYLDEKGRTIKNPKLRHWIESLHIPPAWQDVWISPYKNGHILATGRDARGRKQYIYHPDWHELRKETKFNQLVTFSQHLPTIREITDTHLRSRKLNREKVLAVVVRLLETTLIRIGNPEYAMHNDSYGLTTLQDDHVEVDGETVCFEFRGKSGQEHEINLHDRRLARAVQACQEIPGQRLFQYYDDDGNPQYIHSSDVNTYLFDITGEVITAKVFRTWGASTMAVHYFTHLPAEIADLSPQKQVQACTKAVAGMLGNTVAVCRQYYIHPAVPQAHLEERLEGLYRSQAQPQSPYALRPEEATLVDLIQA